jgi:hypothetical protein
MDQPTAEVPAMFNIYKLTNRNTHAVYIGATCNLRQRMLARFQWNTDARFGAQHDWDFEVIDLAFTAEEAAALEAMHQAAVPPAHRVPAGKAGLGLRDDAMAEHWPSGLGPVDLTALFKTPAAPPSPACRDDNQLQALMHTHGLRHRDVAELLDVTARSVERYVAARKVSRVIEYALRYALQERSKAR